MLKRVSAHSQYFCTHVSISLSFSLSLSLSLSLSFTLSLSFEVKHKRSDAKSNPFTYFFLSIFPSKKFSRTLSYSRTAQNNPPFGISHSSSYLLISVLGYCCILYYRSHRLQHLRCTLLYIVYCALWLIYSTTIKVCPKEFCKGNFLFA